MLRLVSVTYGADPELFLERGGQIIGSEKVIPKQGLFVPGNYKPVVIRDGVQVELNPKASSSIPALGYEVSNSIGLLGNHLKGSDVSISFRSFVEVSRTELDSLSPKSRLLGCTPSKNIFGKRPIKVNPKTYRKRSTGGHQHFGLRDFPNLYENRTDLIAPFAIFVAGLSVLIDRDPYAAERRENYGRAGEFRTPKYGIEYRTLSNFWLRNYSLMSFVFGMAGVAISMIQHDLSGAENIEQELIETVDIDNVIRAIETNSYNLARENFEVIRPFLVKHLPKSGFPLNPSNLDRFLAFTEGVKDKGLEAFFPEDPVASWCSGKQVEFGDFLETIY